MVLLGRSAIRPFSALRMKPRALGVDILAELWNSTVPARDMTTHSKREDYSRIASTAWPKRKSVRRTSEHMSAITNEVTCRGHHVHVTGKANPILRLRSAYLKERRA